MLKTCSVATEKYKLTEKENYELCSSHKGNHRRSR